MCSFERCPHHVHFDNKNLSKLTRRPTGGGHIQIFIQFVFLNFTKLSTIALLTIDISRLNAQNLPKFVKNGSNILLVRLT